ncbi:7984_t:CDS:2 [Funneliformis mosseae]|uniref:7984_t:CDS:1 n=1 Tax=Funneliformis mosseae TaxID=27381 RepID=A0A9N9GF86_FUNMO|nr:7984_t:CDS:2 [Funneliformis mosseae]
MKKYLKNGQNDKNLSSSNYPWKTQWQNIILEQDSLIENISNEDIIQVWHVKRTGSSEVGNYIVLLDDGSHLCTSIFHVNLISSWYPPSN